MSEIRLSDFSKYYTSSMNNDDYNAFEKYDLNNDGVVNDKDVELAPTTAKANQIRSILNYSVDENSSIDENVRETDYYGVPITDKEHVQDDILNTKGTVYLMITKSPRASDAATSCSNCLLLARELSNRKSEINDVASVYALNPTYCNASKIAMQLGATKPGSSYPMIAKFVDGKFVEWVEGGSGQTLHSAQTTVQNMLDKAEGQRDENADKIIDSKVVDYRASIFKTAISELNVTSLRKRIAYEAAMGDEFYQSLSAQIQKNMSNSKWNSIRAQIKEHEDAKKVATANNSPSAFQSTTNVNNENLTEEANNSSDATANNQKASVQKNEPKIAAENLSSIDSIQKMFSKLFEMFSQFMAIFKG